VWFNKAGHAADEATLVAGACAQTMGMANTPSKKKQGLNVLKLGINCPFCFVTGQFTFFYLTCHELIKGFFD
jgi:hypothetical protein